MRTLKFIFPFMLLFFIFSCSDRNPLSSFVDISSPKVVSVSPTNNQIGVQKSSTITVTFSEVVDLSTLASSISISPAVSYSMKVEGNRCVLTPSGNLPEGQRFWLTVADTVEDMKGNRMESGFQSSFKVTGINYSQSLVTFRVDASAVGTSFSVLYITGSWDAFGDYDPTWNGGVRLPLFDDGLHDDLLSGDGIWACQISLSMDLGRQYVWAVDEDAYSDNGYVKSESFFLLSSAPTVRTITLYPPVSVTFNYYDTANKVTGPVYLRGDFNGWSVNDVMSGPSGTERKYSFTKLIKEGTYTYKYYTGSDWNLLNVDNRSVTVTYGAALERNDYTATTKSVVFEYFDTEGKVSGNLYLKGDFNGWSDANLMNGPEGAERRFWTSVNVSAGNSYSYKYFTSNDWNLLNQDNRSILVEETTATIQDYYQGPRNVTFNYYDLEGKVDTSIHLRGDFNSWSLDYSYQLQQDPVTNYKYALTVPLSIGSYQYKYFVDGDYAEVNVENRTVTVTTSLSAVSDYYAGP